MDKTAVITGASSGIGAKIAAYLANEGANVVLAARRVALLEASRDEINKRGKGKAIAVATDVSSSASVEAMVHEAEREFGKIDIYVNNAGLMLEAKLTSGEVEQWEQMIDVNIKGVLYGIHSVLPQLIARSSGHIINLSSVSGQEVTKNSSVYSATKFAVRALSMGMEKELARTGVRVTNISPGMVDTDLTQQQDQSQTRRESEQDNTRLPLQTDDIARAVVYAVTQPDYVNVNELTIRPV